MIEMTKECSVEYCFAVEVVCHPLRDLSPRLCAVPVMGHADGICSIYVDESADIETTLRVVVDSKTDYPVACNSVETLLLHRAVLNSLWPGASRATCFAAHLPFSLHPCLSISLPGFLSPNNSFFPLPPLLSPSLTPYAPIPDLAFALLARPASFNFPCCSSWPESRRSRGVVAIGRGVFLAARATPRILRALAHPRVGGRLPD